MRQHYCDTVASQKVYQKPIKNHRILQMRGLFWASTEHISHKGPFLALRFPGRYYERGSNHSMSKPHFKNYANFPILTAQPRGVQYFGYLTPSHFYFKRIGVHFTTWWWGRISFAHIPNNNYIYSAYKKKDINCVQEYKSPICQKRTALGHLNCNPSPDPSLAKRITELLAEF